MNVHLPLLAMLLLGTCPALAQRPTAEARQAAGAGFWTAGGSPVQFTAPAALPSATPLEQAEHVRAWLTRTCGEYWQERQTKWESAQAYQGQLAGVHPGVVLTFSLLLERGHAGWEYRLHGCRVGAPTRQGLVQWLPIERVLDEADYQPDLRAFQQQLQRALPSL